MLSAIVLSGGKGKRMERRQPKQYLLLAGKPIIMHSIERIDSIEEINEIIIVCEEEYVLAVKLMVEQYNISTPIKFALAGATRQESVYSGLKEVVNEQVILHEAARPFVKREDFIKLIGTSVQNVSFGYPIPFTVLEGKDYICGTLKRDSLINVQLPQKFQTTLLKKAHEAAKRDHREFTEDAGLLFEYTKEKIKIIQGSSENIKITEPIDLIVGEIIYNEHIKGRR